MKKTQLIELFRNINKTKVSFFSIAFFVMLGSTAYLGISWAVQGFTNTVDNTINSYNYQDLEISYPYGLDDEYVFELEKQDESLSVEGGYSCYKYFKNNNSLVQAKVLSLTNKISVVDVVEGTLPQTDKECAVEKYYAENNGIKIGDTIEFIQSDDASTFLLKAIIDNDYEAIKNISSDSCLTNDSFTVTALIDTPEHLGKYSSLLGYSNDEVPINVLIYTIKDAFNKKAFSGYSKVIVSSSSLRNYKYNSDEYIANNENIAKLIEDYSRKYTDSINKQVLANKQDIGRQIQEEITNGELEIEDGRKKISDGEIKINKAKLDLVNAKNELDNAQKEVDNGWAEYNNGLSEYEKANKKITAAQTLYDVANETIDIYKYIYQNLDNFDEQIDDLISTYNSLVTQLGYQLPDSYWIIGQMQQFFTELPDHYDSIVDYVDQYNQFIDNLKQDPNYVSRQQALEEIDNELEKDLPIETKQALNKLRDLINKLYDDIEKIEQLPSNLLTIYDMLEGFGLLESLEDEVIRTIEEKLTSHNLPTLKEMLEDLNNKVNQGFSSYEELKPFIKETFDLISEKVDILDSFMEEEIEPILLEFWDKLASAKQELNVALAQLRSAENKIAEGNNEYNKGLNLLAKNQKELEDAKAEISDAENKIAEGKELYEEYVEATESIKEYDVIVSGKQSNYSIITTGLASDIIAKLKTTMGVLFVIVGAFVSYTAMSRLVHDQTIEIGTKKALGLAQKEITLQYILYSILASILGCFLAIFLSRYVIEPIIVAIISDSFNLHTFNYYFGIDEYIIFSLFETTITVIAAYLASRKILKQKAVKLLTGEEQVLGKQRFYEKSKLWNKLPLLTKTIINNCLNDKRRVFSTIVSIAGCTTLLVCALSFNNNVNKSIEKHINELAKYDTYVYINNESGSAEDDIIKELEKLNIEHVEALNKPGLLKTKTGEYVGTTIYTSNNDEFYEYSRQICNGKQCMPTYGAIISESFCKYNDVSVGDEICYVDSLGKEYTFIVEGISENYTLSANIYISKETYTKEFNKPIINNIMFLRRNNISIDELISAICECDGYTSAFDYESNIINSCRVVTATALAVFAVFLVLSVLMSFLVILNLLVVFVDEKKKETIVLMINGYKKKYAKKYIYSDTIFLTIISIIIGFIFGSVAGIFTTRTLDTSMSTFMTNFYPQTYILAALITSLLCMINSLIALRKIDKYKLTEINSK